MDKNHQRDLDCQLRVPHEQVRADELFVERVQTFTTGCTGCPGSMLLDGHIVLDREGHVLLCLFECEKRASSESSPENFALTAPRSLFFTKQSSS